MLRALISLYLCVAVGVAWAQVEPPEATVDKPISLIRNGDFTQDLGDDWVGGGDKLKVSVFDAKIDGFTKAVRLECSPEEGGQPWDVGFGQRCTAAVGKDDAVYFRAWMRSLDRVRISFIYESTPAYTKVIIQEVRLTPVWKEYRFMGRAFESFQPGGSQAKWWLGCDKGVVELAGVRVENYGPAVSVSRTPSMRHRHPAGILTPEPTKGGRHEEAQGVESGRMARVDPGTGGRRPDHRGVLSGPWAQRA